MKIKTLEPFDLDGATYISYGKKRIYGSGGGGGGQTSTTTPSIPDELKPLANLYVKQATNISQTPYQAYTGQRYADINNTQNLGIGMVQDRALNGSQTMNNAEGMLNNYINAGDTNPYLDSMYNNAAKNVTQNFNNTTLPGVNSTFSLAGRYGSGAHETALGGAANMLGQNLSNMASSMYGNAYSQDRTNQLNAIQQAPTFGNSAYQDASQLLNAGGLQQQNAQNNLDFGYQQFQNASDYPYKQLQATGGVIQGNMGSNTTSSGGGK